MNRGDQIHFIAQHDDDVRDAVVVEGLGSDVHVKSIYSCLKRSYGLSSAKNMNMTVMNIMHPFFLGKVAGRVEVYHPFLLRKALPILVSIQLT